MVKANSETDSMNVEVADFNSDIDQLKKKEQDYFKEANELIAQADIANQVNDKSSTSEEGKK